ncbi:hypothetical protein EDI_335210 [Entamoeba dispar SAW760]|uniref:Uncharacterized protein n=1 Tax=Entamoeba dispar (strain ATCC PRA-260 / SAW760) TaxID=370354 RepID=B0ET02_ENTDS|nr:uncharacterized protein EDI_335210 [Entamoeba dispar SAW760]EDR22365.1 hypothetical protein EDI_335210 [Entamoeba dispar SAW760]|eukprot:EDR22365.1 hypothetical protein EDI_335210 [Entamoeba dispar SAW760]
MKAVFIFALIICINAYPYFGVSAVEKEIAEQKVSMIDSRIENLEDIRRRLLDALDATYEDMFNAGCTKAKAQLKKVVQELRKKIVRVDSKISSTKSLLTKVLSGLNPRARNSVIRHCKVERRFAKRLL